jgi:hypothetical protein
MSNASEASGWHVRAEIQVPRQFLKHVIPSAAEGPAFTV